MNGFVTKWMWAEMGLLLHLYSNNISSNFYFGAQVIHAIFNLFFEELNLIPSCDQMNAICDQMVAVWDGFIVSFHFL